MKRFAIAVVVALVIAGAASASPASEIIHCYGSGCTQMSSTQARITQGGVYIDQPENELVGNLVKLSFDYQGGGALAGSSPEFNIPINTDGLQDASPYGYNSNFMATAGVFFCNNSGSLYSGVVDVVRDSTCQISTPTGVYPNWAALVKAHPTWRIAGQYYMTIYSNGWVPTNYVVSNVQMFLKTSREVRKAKR